LTGWRIDIDAEEPEPTGFDALVANAISDFVKIPSITEEQAELLVRSGFTSANAVLHADLADLEAIEGIGESAKEIVNAVREESERVSLNDEKN
jgi:DNA integrity scanning protein DisA with diadenylate cyclase activity